MTFIATFHFNSPGLETASEKTLNLLHVEYDFVWDDYCERIAADCPIVAETGWRAMALIK